MAAATQQFDLSERLIGLMMIRDESDILQETLENLVRFFDRLFVLDGTESDTLFELEREILKGFSEVKLVLRDRDTPGPFPIRDGARQYLLDRAREAYGVGHWMGVVHGDELFAVDPRPYLASVDLAETIAVQVRLCHFFLHVDDAPKWQQLEQLPVQERVTHYMWPGTPEDRFFFDDGSTHYDVARHSLVVPYEHGDRRRLFEDLIVKQYNYRSPIQMRRRGRARIGTDWQANHYRHIAERDLLFVESLHVPGYDPCGWDNVRETDSTRWSQPRSTLEHPLP